MAGGGEGGGAGEHPGAVSYWYNACEDDEDASLLCGIDFALSADFDPGLMPLPTMYCSIDFAASTDFDPGFMPAMDCGGVDDGFVAEIDRILESIDAETAPAPQPPPVAPPQPPAERVQEAAAVAAVANNVVAVVGSGQRSQSVEARKETRSVEPRKETRSTEPRKETRRETQGDSANGDRGGEWRDGKHPRLSPRADGGPHPDSRRRPMLPPTSRGWDERHGRRDFVDRPRKRDRDRDSNSARRREARGFRERDHGGKMVFRPGTWEQESERDGKCARTQTGGSMKKNADADKAASAHKEKPLAEE
ncbi:endoribonuclease Dicer1 [Hordeum vulgare]|nr:endoribonuclease Dicer1 [Hordeum vulgare]